MMGFLHMNIIEIGGMRRRRPSLRRNLAGSVHFMAGLCGLPQVCTCFLRPPHRHLMRPAKSYRLGHIGAAVGLCRTDKCAANGSDNMVMTRCDALLQVVLPVARTDDGPIGLGLIGPRGADEALLDFAVAAMAAIDKKKAR